MIKHKSGPASQKASRTNKRSVSAPLTIIIQSQVAALVGELATEWGEEPEDIVNGILAEQIPLLLKSWARDQMAIENQRGRRYDDQFKDAQREVGKARDQRQAAFSAEVARVQRLKGVPQFSALRPPLALALPPLLTYAVESLARAGGVSMEALVCSMVQHDVESCEEDLPTAIALIDAARAYEAGEEGSQE